MAKDKVTTQPPEPGVGQPSRDTGRSLDIVHVEIAKIQLDGEYTKKSLSGLEGDMRDLRERMTRLEVRVDHLPTKGFIVAAVIATLTIVGALVTIAPKLQSLAGTAPAASTSTK
jgi:hypothetical protein